MIPSVFQKIQSLFTKNSSFSYWFGALFVLVIFTIFFIIQNWGKTIFGLDAVVPFFGLDLLIKRVFIDATFLTNGPLLANPITIFINIFPLTLIPKSQVFLLAHLVLGTILFLKLIKQSITEKGQNLTFRTGFVSSLAILLFLGTTWIFSQAMVTYVAGFVAVPLGILWFINSKWGSTLRQKLHYLIFLSITVLFIATLALNIAALVFFISQIIILSWILGHISLKFLLKKVLILCVGVILCLQSLSFFTGHGFILSDTYTHFQNLTSHPYSAIVTSDSQKAEESAGGILNTVRFATGWLLIQNNKETVFAWSSDFLQSPLFILAGLVPVGIIIFKFTQDKEFRGNKDNRRLGILWIIGIIVASAYAQLVIKEIPLLGTALRAAPTKLWPILTFPFVILLIKAVRANLTLILCAVVALLVSFFPIFSNGFMAKGVSHEFPTEYITMQKLIDPSLSLSVFPEPSQLYFRSYKWGYFGSEFYSYLYPVTIVDEGNLSPQLSNYLELKRELSREDCGNIQQKQMVLYDRSIVQNGEIRQIEICLETHAISRINNGFLSLYVIE